MRKVLAIVLSVSLVVFNSQGATLWASEVAYAAEKAEAQSMAGITQNPNDSFYTVVGSGFLGLGREIRAISQDMLNRLSGTQPKPASTDLIAPKALMQPTVPTPVEPKVIPEPIVPVTPPKEEPVEVIEKIVDIQKKMIEEEVAKEEVEEEPVVAPPVEEEKVKEEALFVPVAATDGEELTSLLEGEIAGAPFLGISADTYKVIGAVLAITGITFLVLGTSGVFSSGGDGSGGTGNGGGGIGPPGGLGGDGDGEGKGNPPVVPEASTIYLIIAGLCGLFTFRRFRF